MTDSNSDDEMHVYVYEDPIVSNPLSAGNTHQASQPLIELHPRLSSLRGGRYRRSKRFSSFAKALKHGLQRKSQKGLWGNISVGNDLRRPPGVYSVRQFQNNLARAVVAKDTVRFGQLLEKYNQCCSEGHVVEQIQSASLSDEYRVSEEIQTVSVNIEGKRSLLDEVVDYKTGYTMTHLAVVSGVQGLVLSCLEYGSAVHSYEDLNGDTALTLALWCQPDIAFTMLNLGRDVDFTRLGKRGRNLIHSAIPFGSETPLWEQRLDFIKRIVEEDSSLASQRDEFGFLPSEWALDNMAYFTSKKECIQIVEFLRSVEAENAEKKKKQAKAPPADSTGNQLEGKSPAKPKPDELPTVHKETLPSDRVRLFLEGACARLLCIFVMLCLHCLLYAVDVVDRGVDSQYRDTQWDFWFTVFNNIAACWKGSAFFMGMTHAACAFGGAILGAFVYRYGIHMLLGRNLLRLPMCGAQSAEERLFMRKCFGVYYCSIYAGRDRGGYFAMVIGAVLGIYGGAKVYNALLYGVWPGQVSWALIRPVICGIDTVTALRGFWVASLAIDWYVFMFVFDIMNQQGLLNIYLPHRTFSKFAASINGIFIHSSKMKTTQEQQEQVMETNIVTVRMVIFWSLLIIGWAIIAAVFVVLELYYNPAKVMFVSPCIYVPWPGFPVLIASLCMLLECVVLSQEWTWPSLQEHPQLFFPGLVINTHHVFFLMLLLIVQWSLDLRIILGHFRQLWDQAGMDSSKDRLFLCISLIPAGVGILLLLQLIIRSSLWWEKCGDTGRAIMLYSEHMYFKPCPLDYEEKALKVAEDEKKALHREFSRSLYCLSKMENRKEKLRVRDAVKRVGRQLHADTSEEEGLMPRNSRSGEHPTMATVAWNDLLSDEDFIRVDSE